MISVRRAIDAGAERLNRLRPQEARPLLRQQARGLIMEHKFVGKPQDLSAVIGTNWVQPLIAT
jgi:hypothetical protein